MKDKLNSIGKTIDNKFEGPQAKALKEGLSIIEDPVGFYFRTVVSPTLGDTTEAYNLLKTLESTFGAKEREEVITYDPLYDTNIKKLNISTMEYNQLREMGIQTYGDLTSHREKDIKNKRGIGKGSLKNIYEAMKEKGLEFNSTPGYIKPELRSKE